MQPDVFRCGHPREGDNVLTFSNGRKGTSSRCRACHTEYQTSRSGMGRRALQLILALHVEGILSEGQLCRALGAERVEFRAMVDAFKARDA